MICTQFLRANTGDWYQYNGMGLPSEIGNLSSLKRLGLSSTDIGGSLPTEIGLLEKLTSLDARKWIVPLAIGLIRLVISNHYNSKLR